LALFKPADVSTCVAPHPGWLNTVTTPKNIDQIY
jgi:hypothetical protein